MDDWGENINLHLWYLLNFLLNLLAQFCLFFFFFPVEFFPELVFLCYKKLPYFSEKWVLFLERGMMEILRLCLVPGKFEGKYQGKDIGRKSKKKKKKEKRKN